MKKEYHFEVISIMVKLILICILLVIYSNVKETASVTYNANAMLFISPLLFMAIGYVIGFDLDQIMNFKNLGINWFKLYVWIVMLVCSIMYLFGLDFLVRFLASFGLSEIIYIMFLHVFVGYYINKVYSN